MNKNTLIGSVLIGIIVIWWMTMSTNNAKQQAEAQAKEKEAAAMQAVRADSADHITYYEEFLYICKLKECELSDCSMNFLFQSEDFVARTVTTLPAITRPHTEGTKDTDPGTGLPSDAEGFTGISGDQQTST